MSTDNTSIEQIAEVMLEMAPVEQLSALEMMHRRVIEIGDERLRQLDTAAGTPEPGKLGGIYATRRRTTITDTLFYDTDVYGEPIEGASSVPIFPADEFDLLNRINGLGMSILASLTPEHKVQAHLRSYDAYRRRRHETLKYNSVQ